MSALSFSEAIFKTRYPEFVSVPASALSAYWDEAYDRFRGADSLVSDEGRRRRLLNSLTAHIAALNGALSADGRPAAVGRVSQASKGSVSATMEYAQPKDGTEAWFNQTQYGASFWVGTLNLRRFRYVSQPTVY